MAQVMVNFRLDEDVKKNMEQACREMGLSMTTAFTIFAKKVGNEKRIPFEITADPRASEPYRRPGGRQAPKPTSEEETPVLVQKQERLDRLCAEIRQSLTAVHTAIPASITGLPIERIRLLCGHELKDKAAGVSNAARPLFSSRNAELLRQKDLGILDEYLDGLASIAQELLDVEHTLVPIMKARQGEDSGGFEPYVHRLNAISQSFDELDGVMQRFLSSTACTSGAPALQARIRQAAGAVETPYVLTALDNLEALLLRHYDLLDDPAKTRLEADYLQTLELTLHELGQAEHSGGDVNGKAALCLRVVNVLSQVVFDGAQARREWNQRSLEAEVAALERLAAMRGDVSGGMKTGS